MSWGDITIYVAVIALALGVVAALITLAIMAAGDAFLVRASDLDDDEPDFDLAEPNRSSWER